MIEIDTSDVYKQAHGSDNKLERADPFRIDDTAGDMSKRYVCRKLLEVRQAIENFRMAVASTGEPVRFDVSTVFKDGKPEFADDLAATVVMAAVVDGMSGWRSMYLDLDDHDVVDGMIVREMHDACNIGSYVRRTTMRLRSRS